MRILNSLQITSLLFVLTTFSVTSGVSSASPVIKSNWIDPARIMVIYNTTRMDSIDPAELDSFPTIWANGT